MTASNSVNRSLALIVGIGCAISAITFGIRSAFGLFTDPISIGNGWDRDVFALAIAIQNLGWGIGQPLAGPIIDRYGPARVLAVGGALYAAGTALMALADSSVSLYLTAGIMVGLGMGGASYITVLAAFARIVPAEKRPWALGIGTAAGSMGQFAFAPLGQAFIAGYGWQTAALLLGGFVALVPFLAMAFRGAAMTAAAQTGGAEIGIGDALRHAFRHPSYILLFSGFFVCGFQLAFITIHLPPYLTDRGLSADTAAWAIAAIGLFNMVGAYLSGQMSGRYSKSYLLSFIYLGRAAAITALVLLPISTASVMGFAIVTGLLWLSTAPPTSGLVAAMFGTRHMATLFGLVFFSHQIGSFLGAWLGGLLFARTGSYDIVWWLSVALGLIAALLHWPINERQVPAFFAARP